MVAAGSKQVKVVDRSASERPSKLQPNKFRRRMLRPKAPRPDKLRPAERSATKVVDRSGLGKMQGRTLTRWRYELIALQRAFERRISDGFVFAYRTAAWRVLHGCRSGSAERPVHRTGA